MSSSNQVSAERTIPAPAEAIFDLLADPRRHRELDGSGTVRDAYDGPDRLSLGARFGMGMRMGLPYRMVNEVIELEENRRIAWQTRPASGLLARGIGGRIWRYELEPVEGGTLVRETWDISEEKLPALVRPLAGQTRTAMEKTLARMEQLVS